MIFYSVVIQKNRYIFLVRHYGQKLYVIKDDNLKNTDVRAFM